MKCQAWHVFLNLLVFLLFSLVVLLHSPVYHIWPILATFGMKKYGIIGWLRCTQHPPWLAEYHQQSKGWLPVITKWAQSLSPKPLSDRSSDNPLLFCSTAILHRTEHTTGWSAHGLTWAIMKGLAGRVSVAGWLWSCLPLPDDPFMHQANEHLPVSRRTDLRQLNHRGEYVQVTVHLHGWPLGPVACLFFHPIILLLPFFVRLCEPAKSQPQQTKAGTKARQVQYEVLRRTKH